MQSESPHTPSPGPLERLFVEADVETPSAQWVRRLIVCIVGIVSIEAVSIGLRIIYFGSSANTPEWIIPATALALAALLAVIFMRRWHWPARFVALLVIAGVAALFPLGPNHGALTALLLAPILWLNPHREDDRRDLLLSTRVAIFACFFWSGAQKLAWGDWGSAQTLLWLADLRSGVPFWTDWVYAAAHPPGPDGRLVNYCAIALWPRLLSWATVAAELILPLALFSARLRTVALLASAVLFVAIEALAGEYSFGLLMLTGFVAWLAPARSERLLGVWMWLAPALSAVLVLGRALLAVLR